MGSIYIKQSIDPKHLEIIVEGNTRNRREEFELRPDVTDALIQFIKEHKLDS